MSENTTNPNVKHYSAEDVIRLKKLFQEGRSVLEEVELLKSGLSETVKSIAEEIGVKPAQLNKAIRIAYKKSLSEERDKFEEIEDLLQTLGLDL